MTFNEVFEGFKSLNTADQNRLPPGAIIGEDDASVAYCGVPYVGCPTSEPVGSDSYPGTVVWVSKDTIEHEYPATFNRGKCNVMLPKKIKVARCGFRAVKGHSNAYTEDQRYEYYVLPASDVTETVFSYRSKVNRYVRVGVKSNLGQTLMLGYRRAYLDPSF